MSEVELSDASRKVLREAIIRSLTGPANQPLKSAAKKPGLFPAPGKSQPVKDAIAFATAEGTLLFEHSPATPAGHVGLTGAGLAYALKHEIVSEGAILGRLEAAIGAMSKSQRQDFAEASATHFPTLTRHVVAAIDALDRVEVAASRAAERVRAELLHDYHRSQLRMAEENVVYHGHKVHLLGQVVGDELPAKSVAAEPAEPAEAPEPRLLPEPKGEDLGFRRAVVEEFVESWAEYVRDGNAAAAKALDIALRNVPGVRRVGVPGESSVFDPVRHDSRDAAGLIESGNPCRVVQSGWEIDGITGKPVVMKAIVTKA